ncbi:MAG TPA: class I SAM-dependent methyltransferase [Candidatus Parcubacteria bacterium]|jgi:predicted SAM-dependent methyltransferase|nr:class I SAM-dependent methyltransferase [Candidatus Parcubacteria bacterium]
MVDKEVKLDIGCGKNKKEGFIGIDIDPNSDADIVTSALNLPFENSSVDEISSSHLVEHFPPAKLQKFFDEIYRVLKPGAKAGLKVDRDWSEKRLLKKDSDHKKRYSVKEIEKMVERFNYSKVKREIYRFGWHIRNKIFIELKK